jgi:hypothetical protein
MNRLCMQAIGKLQEIDACTTDQAFSLNRSVNESAKEDTVSQFSLLS